MRRILLIGVGMIFLLAASQNNWAQLTGFNKIRWSREKIAPGLLWKSSHTILNDSVPQNINILIVNLHKREISLIYNPERNISVSRQADSVNAIAAINGGFFNIRNGGSTTYIKTAGRITDIDTAKKWSRNANMDGSVLIKSGKEIFIEKAMTNSWYDSHTEYSDVLVSGPLLVKNKAISDLPVTALVKNRHPRSAVGTRNERRAIFITLDGRTNEAAGMTLAELSHLLMLLHCRDAVNLDGGGSTTMWIRGKPFNGVVNMPCDNKKFDHEGGRAVSDILIIK